MSWLECKALRGMLSGEVTVLVSTSEGDRLSMFVPNDNIRLTAGHTLKDLDGVEIDAFLEVNVLDGDNEFGLIALPAEPLEGSRVTKVARELLHEHI